MECEAEIAAPTNHNEKAEPIVQRDYQTSHQDCVWKQDSVVQLKPQSNKLLQK